MKTKTISKFFLSLLLFPVLSALMIVGCSKTKDDSLSNLSREEINFTVGSMPSTKTAYTQEDKSLQLVWVVGDTISVFCDQADGNKKGAFYEVTPKSEPKEGTLSVAETDGIGLCWGIGNHNLYAVYPKVTLGGNVKKESEEGVFTFDFYKTQYCSTDGEYVSGTNHRLKPDMSLSYMVAKQDGVSPTTNTVNLIFKPISTTFEITLQAAQGDVTISGLELDVTINNTGDNSPNNDKFIKDNGTNYQIQFDARADFSTDVSNALMQIGNVNKATFNVGLRGGGTYTIASGNSVTFTVFLPPIKNIDDVNLKCYGTGGTLLGTKQIFVNNSFAPPASKNFFRLSPFTSTPTIQSMTLSPTTMTLVKGSNNYSSGTLTATVTMSDGSNRTTGFKWEDIGGNFTYIATGDFAGTSNTLSLTANSVGSTTIKVTYGTESRTARVNVVDNITDFRITPSHSDIKIGERVQVKAEAKFYGNSYYTDVTREVISNRDWGIGSSGISLDYSSGYECYVIGKNLCTNAKVYANYGGKRAEATVTVTEPAPTLEVTTTDPGNLHSSSATHKFVYQFGLKHQLKVELVYYNGKREDVTNSVQWWIRDGSSYTSMDKGLVTIKGDGTTTYEPRYYTSTFGTIKCEFTVAPYIWKRFSQSDYVTASASTTGSAITFNDCLKYLGAGVYYSEDDGYIFAYPSGTLSCEGVWLKRSPGNATPQSKVTPSSGRPTAYGQYFYLPCSGFYCWGYNDWGYVTGLFYYYNYTSPYSGINGPTKGLYWLKTGDAVAVAYALWISPGINQVYMAAENGNIGHPILKPSNYY